MSTISLSYDGLVAVLALNRPAVHNACDAAMVAELRAAFAALAADAAVRVVVLTGVGASFCAGADLDEVRASRDWSQAEHLAEAENLAALFNAAWSLPKPLVGRINGAALGIGAGLVACCDIAVASDAARFGFTAVKLGLVPAVLAPVLVPKIGVGHARALFVSGERITAERAFEIGLVHAVTGSDDIDITVTSIVRRMLTSAPEAVASAKRVVSAMWSLERDAARRFAVEASAAAHASAEAQEGAQAFLDKRKPSWS